MEQSLDAFIDHFVDAILTAIRTDIEHYIPPGNCQNAKESSGSFSGNFIADVISWLQKG